ncbi:hypothetical protein ACFOLJ_26655 [Rugamonas sp. CCM 8940]|uniref:hypothetical protein n=1 Tax=Rugamonas sp. CCM 8940 TaxID=2765359 RepID=UPI0018F2E8AE|nr:hypothetical protein [Rugamonas sp. CCM 8940]MBJ7311006.1 hypothetical protein [Rugamonas sp. CCM 8940]
MPTNAENPVPSSPSDDDPPIADLDKRAYYKYMESRLNIFEANQTAMRSDLHIMQGDVHSLRAQITKLELSCTEQFRRLELSCTEQITKLELSCTEQFSKLELNLAKTQADMELLKKDRGNYVTKAYLQEELLKITWRIIGLLIVTNSTLVGATFYIARHFP